MTRLPVTGVLAGTAFLLALIALVIQTAVAWRTGAAPGLAIVVPLVILIGSGTLFTRTLRLRDAKRAR